MRAVATRMADPATGSPDRESGKFSEILLPKEDGRIQAILPLGWVHFVFARETEVTFEFSPHYQRKLKAGNYYLLYDQNRDLSVILHSSCPIFRLSLHPEVLHTWLVSDYDDIPNLNFSGFGVKEYSEHSIHPYADITLAELMQPQLPTSLGKLYKQAKVRELISYCFDIPEEIRYENCPFLKDKDNVERIKMARKILIERMAEPPTLCELAREIGMNEYNLKVGFKNVYGMPAYKYLQQYRLEHARKLLCNGNCQVSEIAEEVGYTTSSHFIEAFRKHFGITPKQFQMDRH